MKKIKNIIIITILIITLFIGNGYAIAISEKIATVNQPEFKVRFSENPKVSNENKIKAEVINDLNATINVTGLTMEENTEMITYIVKNDSKTLDANLSIETTNSNKEYFFVESKIEKETLANGEATKLIIKIELLKEPIKETEKATIGIKLKATPIQHTGENSNSSQKDQTSSSTTPPQYDYYEKDETPKTGNSKLINFLWR